MIFDGDQAGEMATLRSLDILIDEGINVRVAPLPKGMDPDVLVRRSGPEGLKTKIAQSLSFFDYKLDLLKSRHDINDAHGKSKIAAEMLSTINKFDNAILKGEYTKKLAEAIKIPERHIVEELNKIKPLQNSEAAGPVFKKKRVEINPAEKLLVKFMLEEKELIEKIMQELSLSDFQDERTAKVVSAIQEMAVQGKNIQPNFLMNYFSEDEATQFVCETIFMPDLDDQDREKAVNDCINRIKVDRLKSKRENLHKEINAAQLLGDEQKLNSLIREFHNLIKKGD
jgi:DNA primase